MKDIASILDDFVNSFKEMLDMITILDEDCKEHYEAIKINNGQTQRRAYVRSVFALIEGILHRTKVATAHIDRIFGTIPTDELAVIEDTHLDINDKGNIAPKPFYPPFLENLKLTFSDFSKSTSSPFKLSIGGKGWRSLNEAVKVRNRLMHPKETKDLQVSDLEIKATRQAHKWFLVSYLLCTHHAQRSSAAQRSDTNKVTAIDETISMLEAKLASGGN